MPPHRDRAREHTDPAAVQAGRLCRRIDKLPLPCRSAPGFMV